MNKKTGVAFGGGLVLGAAHIGVLKALEEAGIRPHKVLGVSVGALIGALYCSGLNAREIEEIAVDLSWWDLASISISRMGLLSNQKMGDLVHKHTRGKTFDELKPALIIPAIDVSSGEIKVIESGSLSDAVRASTAIPGIFHPVEIDGQLLVDGGLVEKTCYEPLKKDDVDSIVVVDVQAHQNLKKPHNLMDVLLNAFEIMVEGMVIADGVVDVKIAPQLAGYSRTNTSNVKQIIDVGYECAKEVLVQWDQP